jgi:hypothetical protein
MAEMEIDTYFGRFFYCRKCKRWEWHDRVRKIKGRDVWNLRLFSCMECKTIVDWDGKEYLKEEKA